jgi:hypothetical protein
MGGRGQGSGGNAPLAPTPTRTVDQREKVENRGGDIIARELIEGDVEVGERRAALARVAERISRGDEEGVTDDPVPPHLRDVHRHYFGEVEKRIRAATRTSEKKPGATNKEQPAALPAPAESGKP